MLSVNFRHSDGLDLYNKLKAVVEPQYGMGAYIYIFRARSLGAIRTHN